MQGKSLAGRCPEIVAVILLGGCLQFLQADGKEVCCMSDYEILTVILYVIEIILFIVFYIKPKE